jgi:FKBP-type peptidyl-prolyl cis-trans isomerase
MKILNIKNIRSLATWTILGAVMIFVSACNKEQTADGSASVGEASPASSEASQDLVLETADQLASYGVGYNVGSSLTQDGLLEADRAAIIAGIVDGLEGNAPQVDQVALQGAGAEIQARAAAKAAETNAANLAAATAFLAENAGREGVTITESGLQYEVITASSDPDAPKPLASDTVEVHYHGTLTDGTVFDSSVENGETVSFPLAGVIPGWTEALQLMSVGDKWKIYLPPSIAYGAQAVGPIPPNSALIFEVELINIVTPAAEEAPEDPGE